MEEDQNFYEILFLIHLLFIFKSENTFNWQVFDFKSVYDSFIFNKEAEQL